MKIDDIELDDIEKAIYADAFVTALGSTRTLKPKEALRAGMYHDVCRPSGEISSAGMFTRTVEARHDARNAVRWHREIRDVP